MSGGLDALETLGKKTMEVLSEGDPGKGSSSSTYVYVRTVLNHASMTYFQDH